MISTRPYLIRAFYEWIVDSSCTPHIVVNAEYANVEVPRNYVESGQIVLNVAMQAVQNLALNNDAISFQARFGGVAHELYVPVPAVMAIYARENGRGMVFSEDEDDDTDAPPPSEETASGSTGKAKGKGHLTVVK
mgnify:CR=1 FL=1